MSAILEFIENILKTQCEEQTVEVFDKYLKSQIGDCKHVLFENGLSWHLPSGFVGTLSSEWAEIYLRRNYHYHDPIAQHSLKTLKPFDWHEASQRTRKGDQIMSLAEDFEMTEGYCFPVARNGYYSAAISVTGNDIKIPEKKIPELQLAMIYYHGRILSFQHQPVITHGRDDLFLSRRETQCLVWVARGKTDWEISEILSIGETTVHGYIEGAKTKLSAVTRAQAVVEALKLGLIAL